MSIGVVQARMALLNVGRWALRAAVERGRRAAASTLIDRRNQDLLAGKAGGIFGLLAFSSMPRDESSKDLAMKIGDDLLASVAANGILAWSVERGACRTAREDLGSSFADAVCDALGYADRLFDSIGR